MRLHNSLTKKTEDLAPLDPTRISIYSCGPTVYDRVHIGNLSAFITADTLRRVLVANSYEVKHVMNLTDVDDKTIKRSLTEYPDLEPNTALSQTTNYYTAAFMRDSELIGNDIDAFEFVKATDTETMESIQIIIAGLIDCGVAYIADDGIYFNIKAYQDSGRTYGQLVELTAASTSTERISNDEYDKDSAHDFALWKLARPGEPTWTIAINGQEFVGRPGWHIECSAMTRLALGQPFDIHTGGIDLKFPHHENEIAQSTACNENPVFASMFVHNEHILVDGRKMSKSLNNFYTLEDLTKRGISPLAFRMLVLQSHYRSQINFTFEAMTAATARLQNWRNYAALRHQTHDTVSSDSSKEHLLLVANRALVEKLSDDLDTPSALSFIDQTLNSLDIRPIDSVHRSSIVQLFETIDETLGLQILETTPDISDDIKQQIIERERVREQKDWEHSDELRDSIYESARITLLDTPSGTIWQY